MNIEIASIILEICIVPEPATTSGTGLLLGRDTGHRTGLKNCVIIIPAKLCNQRKKFSHDVEVYNKVILHLPGGVHLILGTIFFLLNLVNLVYPNFACLSEEIL